MQTCTAKQLKKMMDDPGNVSVINVLPQASHQDKHIPGSVNIPLESDGFVERVESLVGKRDAKVVVYCANEACNASPRAAATLAHAGFQDVADFEGGVKAWEEAGYALEGQAVGA